MDDPHLWERARGLGLDLERFERDRRSDGGRRARAPRFRERDSRRRDRDPGGLRRRADAAEVEPTCVRSLCNIAANENEKF